MKEIKLYNLVGVSLIMQTKSGFKYINQTRGSACLESFEEGILMPFNNDYNPANFEHSLEKKLNDLLFEVSTLTEELADKIDYLLQQDPETAVAHVNRDKLVASHEAWVYLNVVPSVHSCLFDLGEFQAVMTWPNSD